ncbi:MAG: tail fiber domain-containing protein [Bacteroidetes bacterium]|nr:tail fiber domain-containing protein [Bacteroidota bacterium]
MKKRILAITLAVCGFIGFIKAQAPNLFSYQAVIRDGNGTLVVSASIGLELKIRQGGSTGTVVYSELQNLNSNANGLVTAQIGAGSVVSGNLSSIDWSKGPYFLECNTDPTGGTNFTIKGTTQLLSVPYALYATKAGNTNNPSILAGQGIKKSGDTIHAQNELDIWNAGKIKGKPISGATPAKDDILQWNGTEWAPNKTSSGGGGGTLNVVAGIGMKKSGDTLHALNKQSLWSASDLQGRNIVATAPAKDDVLRWNGSAWAPAAITGGSGGGNNPTVAGYGLSKNGDTLSAKASIALWNAAFLQDNSISATKPKTDEVLQYNGSLWAPTLLKGMNIFAGTGLIKNADTVYALNNSAMWNASLLQGRSVSSTAPATNDVLKWNGSSWAPGTGGSGSSISCGTSSNTSYTVRGTGSGGWECTDAIWINSTKNVGIGTTSPSSSFDLSIGTSGLLVNGTTTTSNFAGRVRIGSTSTTSYDLQVDGDGYMTGSLRVGTTSTPATGGIMANGVIETNARFIMNSSTSGTGTTVVRTSAGELRPTSSTIHIKENVKNLQFSKEKLFSLRPVSYNLKPALGGDHEIGFIAEEVAEFMPELVVFGPERKWKGNTGIAETDASGKEILNHNKIVPYSVHYDRLPVYLLSIIKEQDAQIKNLEERLEKLERR